MQTLYKNDFVQQTWGEVVSSKQKHAADKFCLNLPNWKHSVRIFPTNITLSHLYVSGCCYGHYARLWCWTVREIKERLIVMATHSPCWLIISFVSFSIWKGEIYFSSIRTLTPSWRCNSLKTRFFRSSVMSRTLKLSNGILLNKM